MIAYRWAQRRIALILGPILFLLITLWRHPNWTDNHVHTVLHLDPSHLDLNSPETKAEFCKQHNWKPFHTPNHQTPRRVYDLFMVNTELDWLEIRLNATYDHVDFFVIVESPKTFTNRDKPLIIKEKLDIFSRYGDKIIYHELEIPDGFHSDRSNPAWAWEDLQRNAMYDQVFPRLQGNQAPLQGDVIIVADVDEIVRPETIAILKACDFPPRLNLRSDFYYYSFQFRHKGEQWAHPQATYYRGSKTILPIHLRNSDGGFQPLIKLETADLWNAGWHCSSCFATMEELLTKLSSFSHQWMNHGYFRDKERIASHVREGKDLWERDGQEFERIHNNRDIPQIFIHEPERFAYLLDRDGLDAGFKDYP